MNITQISINKKVAESTLLKTLNLIATASGLTLMKDLTVSTELTKEQIDLIEQVATELKNKPVRTVVEQFANSDVSKTEASNKKTAESVQTKQSFKPSEKQELDHQRNALYIEAVRALEQRSMALLEMKATIEYMVQRYRTEGTLPRNPKVANDVVRLSKLRDDIDEFDQRMSNTKLSFDGTVSSQTQSLDFQDWINDPTYQEEQDLITSGNANNSVPTLLLGS